MAEVRAAAARAGMVAAASLEGAVVGDPAAAALGEVGSVMEPWVVLVATGARAVDRSGRVHLAPASLRRCR